LAVISRRRGGSGFKALTKEIAKKKFCYLILIPSFALLMTFNYYPAFSALYHSAFNWNGFNLNEFVGIGNFKEMWNDPIIRVSVLNLIKLTTAALIIALTFPLIAAELIFHLRNLKFAYFYRILFVVPMVVPGMVNLLIWKFIYDPNLGLINQILGGLGLEDLQRAWLGDFDISLFAIIFVGFPWVSGFSLLIYLAGLQNIPPTIFDAAAIDGASGLTRIFRIDLPMITAQIKLLLILALIGVLQGFVNIMILTGGGPGNVTMVPALHMYNSGFLYGRMGYACAIGTALFVVILTLTYINLKYIRSSSEYTPSS